MLYVRAYIEELIGLAKGNLKICRMNWWLLKYENEFKEAINQTACSKWSAWFYQGKKLYPCVCSKREDLCVFIDLYRELDRLTQIQRYEKKFQDYFNRFQIIKNSFDDLDQWMSDIRPIISSIYLMIDRNDDLKIKFHNTEPAFEVNINKHDYKYTLLCMNIFNHHMYVKDYQ